MIAVVVVLAAPALCDRAQAQDQQLVLLRQQLALNYLEPEPHMALVKYYLNKGDRLQAYYLLEYARRGRFPREQFDRAFLKAFGEPARTDNSGNATFNRAIQLQTAGNLKKPKQIS